MNPYQAYQQQQDLAWTRVDMLLALYDAAIEKLEQARRALAQHDRKGAEHLVNQGRLIVYGLVAGINPAYEEIVTNFHRLYDFVLFSLKTVHDDKIEGAVRVLRILREGFQQIRAEAIQQERAGIIPPVGTERTLQVSA